MGFKQVFKNRVFDRLNQDFGPNLTYLESFKGRVPEKAKMSKNLYNKKNNLNLLA